MAQINYCFIILLFSLSFGGCGIHRITSSPPGATVYINNDSLKKKPSAEEMFIAPTGLLLPKAKTPYELKGGPFDHWYQVRKPGFYDSDIVFLEGKVLTGFASHHFNLKPIAAKKKATPSTSKNDTIPPTSKNDTIPPTSKSDTIPPISKNDTTPPTILLQRGIKLVKVKARKIIKGQAIDSSGVAIVEINGEEAQLDEKGNFSAAILLKPGNNTVFITAIDVYRNKATKTIVVERKSELVGSMSSETIIAGKYLALLIAVENYHNISISNLNQPIKDAKRIKNVLLQKYTFNAENIILLENPNRDDIINAFDHLSQKLTKNDNLLIFYAGHGYWDKTFKQGYWLPSNASKNSRSKWLSNSTIRDYIRGIQAKHTLLISDACFGGSIFKTRSAFNDVPPATNELYKLPSRKVMTSGTLTEVPDKSVFIEYFVKRLQENENKYLSSEHLFVKFKDAVINNSPINQVPQYGAIRETGDEGGDFIFVRRDD